MPTCDLQVNLRAVPFGSVGTHRELHIRRESNVLF